MCFIFTVSTILSIVFFHITCRVCVCVFVHKNVTSQIVCSLENQWTDECFAIKLTNFTFYGFVSVRFFFFLLSSAAFRSLNRIRWKSTQIDYFISKRNLNNLQLFAMKIYFVLLWTISIRYNSEMKKTQQNNSFWFIFIFQGWFIHFVLNIRRKRGYQPISNDFSS